MAACGLAQPGAASIEWVLMIHFTLLRVPVSIHPTLWLTLAFLGRAFCITSLVDALCVMLFIIAGFVCLLVHEMGHALVGRALGGGRPEVYLAWMGGDCTNETARFTRMQGVLMTAAGPLASTLLGLAAYAALGLYIGDFAVAADWGSKFMLGYMPMESVQQFPPLAMFFFFFLIEICCWWTLLNLLPVFPLDGGQIMQGLMRSRRQMHGISLVVAVGLTVTFATLGLWLLTVFMVLLAVLNHRFYQQTSY